MIRKLKKGFTLVELVVVIAVVAILAAVSVVSYIGITKKAQESNDHSMIDQINVSVASASIPNRKATLHEVLEDLKEDAGFGVEKLTPELDGAEFVYSYSMNKFAYYKGGQVVYPEDVKNSASATGVDLWFFKDIQSSTASVSLEGGKSFYIKSVSPVVTTLTVHGGVDVGSNSITNINYENTTAGAQTVRIRTSGLEASLSVNAPQDTVHHYDDLFELNVVSVDPSHSYHEHGRVRGKAVIAEGHFVVEEDATVNNIVVSESAETNSVSIDINSGSSVQSIMDYSEGAVKTSESTIPETVTKVDVVENKEAYVKSTNTCYDTLYAAINAAQSGDLVLLLKDVSITDTYYDSVSKGYYSILIDKDLTLDGNDKTITATGKVEGQDNKGNDIYTHDCFLCISKSTATRSAEILMKNLNIISTTEQDALLAQENFAFGPTVTLDKVNINCEGECLYSNGGTSTVIAYDCYFEHSGVYATGKDPVYYSAVIVGYAGSASLYNCDIKSFGNGVATFPSGGTINLNNTNISSTFSVEESLSGYALYAWNGTDNSNYVNYGNNAIINVHSGNIEGEFGFVDTSAKWSTEINIYSGTFDHDPTEYVEAGKFIEHSGSKWIVS